ncbi:hypothetical protein JOM56_010361 [Amanita muscaria]
MGFSSSRMSLAESLTCPCPAFHNWKRKKEKRSAQCLLSDSKPYNFCIRFISISLSKTRELLDQSRLRDLVETKTHRSTRFTGKSESPHSWGISFRIQVIQQFHCHDSQTERLRRGASALHIPILLTEGLGLSHRSTLPSKRQPNIFYIGTLTSHSIPLTSSKIRYKAAMLRKLHVHFKSTANKSNAERINKEKASDAVLDGVAGALQNAHGLIDLRIMVNRYFGASEGKLSEAIKSAILRRS